MPERGFRNVSSGFSRTHNSGRQVTWRHNSLLVSFCNIRLWKEPSTVLGVLRADDGNFEQVLTVNSLPECLGFTGIFVGGTSVLIAAQMLGRKSELIELERQSLTILGRYSLEGAVDVHSIALLGNDAFVVSTGTDEIIRYARRGQDFVRQEVVWRPEWDGPLADNHHMNGLCLHNGELVVSGFGRRTSEKWALATNGFVWNINRDTCLAEGIDHPHSVASVGGRLVLCESRRSRIRFLGGDVVSEALPGYARGMGALGENLVVGISEGRKVSKSAGLVNNPMEAGRIGGGCGVATMSSSLRVERVWDLSTYGHEIYDVARW